MLHFKVSIEYLYNYEYIKSKLSEQYRVLLLEKKIFSNILHFKQDSSLIIIILVAFVFILVCCASTLKYGFVKPILATSRFALFIKDTSFTFFFFLFFFKCLLQLIVNICNKVSKLSHQICLKFIISM